jgi:hypothetical protein
MTEEAWDVAGKAAFGVAFVYALFFNGAFAFCLFWFGMIYLFVRLLRNYD